jgi:hypothetical protein
MDKMTGIREKASKLFQDVTIVLPQAQFRITDAQSLLVVVGVLIHYRRSLNSIDI